MPLNKVEMNLGLGPCRDLKIRHPTLKAERCKMGSQCSFLIRGETCSHLGCWKINWQPGSELNMKFLSWVSRDTRYFQWPLKVLSVGYAWISSLSDVGMPSYRSKTKCAIKNIDYEWCGTPLISNFTPGITNIVGCWITRLLWVLNS